MSARSPVSAAFGERRAVGYAAEPIKEQRASVAQRFEGSTVLKDEIAAQLVVPGHTE